MTDTQGLPRLDYKYGNRILLEDETDIKIQLPNENVTLKKSYYVNTHYRKDFIIYDSGAVFIAIATKYVKTSYIFDKLMAYSIAKIDNRINQLKTHFESRIDKLENLKQDYQGRIKNKELVAA